MPLRAPGLRDSSQETSRSPIIPGYHTCATRTLSMTKSNRAGAVWVYPDHARGSEGGRAESHGAESGHCMHGHLEGFLEERSQLAARGRWDAGLWGTGCPPHCPCLSFSSPPPPPSRDSAARSSAVLGSVPLRRPPPPSLPRRVTTHRIASGGGDPSLDTPHCGPRPRPAGQIFSRSQGPGA